jgi:hypothetical protein
MEKSRNKIYSLQKIIIFIVIGILWFILGTQNWLPGGHYLGDQLKGGLGWLILFLTATGMIGGLTLFVWGVIKFFKR